VIGKALRGNNARRLLYYLYGPGRANEHADPHLIAGFSDPADLEPERRRDGSRDFRRLAGLLEQPLAALAGPGFDRPVWHCAIRAAPGDRILSDAEWEKVAARVMDRTGLAPLDDDLGVRWVAVRHAADHVHLVVTLARQDGTRPRIWNDFYRVREACLAAEQDLGLRTTAPADRTAARRATRAETEQSARQGWDEPPRVMLRRAVSTAAAGAGNEREFLARLQQAGLLVRLRRSTTEPDAVTGYTVGLAHHTSRDGGVIWYGGGKLAADLTLPKLRARWATPTADRHVFGAGLSPAAARAVLRHAVTGAAGQAPDEAGFFARLREGGVLVKLRFGEADPGQVTGYSVALPWHTGPGGAAPWYGGGRLAAGLTLPRLRHLWDQPRSAGAERCGAFHFTASEQNAIYEHAGRQAAAATEQIRRVGDDLPGATDTAWAAADTLHVMAQVLGSPELRCAADAYDRAARAPHGRIPHRTRDGDQLRAAARLVALLGNSSGDGTLALVTLIAKFVALTAAIAEFRQVQQHATQAAAARAAAEHLHAAATKARSAAARPGSSRTTRRPRTGAAAESVRRDFPARLIPTMRSPVPHSRSDPRPGSRHLPLPPRRAGPAR